MVESYIRDVPDFPKKGILFKDITPLLQSPKGLKEAVAGLAKAVDPKSYELVCVIESRGFIFGTALAHHLGKGFIPIRKPGKLPWKTASESYELEYGTDTIEIHVDAADGGRRVLMIGWILRARGRRDREKGDGHRQCTPFDSPALAQGGHHRMILRPWNAGTLSAV